ncbi:HpcH/HpaI aldolase/citrate lyase family protein [Gulosibacter molinativorax]|uniref:CoA ester lyase n=1 Tax=Gulosibacter molinativorax TaxID=256821 RepID=A0ABT7C9S8_9MICO|nr:CoA ester lyase [Gulosibacter molinativorax]MDJ1371963.1 CoA ester lyase [Gulosibacter molinativorax]QUY62673.1 HpcH/HpaI aldolase/citrate lyase family protein [Gulosibacter molinativorax]
MSDARNEANTTDGPKPARLDLARTALFVPATRPERIAKAFAAGADAVIVDLEDAVAADAKGWARDTLTRVFDQPQEFDLDGAAQPIAIRFSTPSSEDGKQDIDWLESIVTDDARVARLDSIMVAKIETTAELDLVAKVLDASSAAAGVSLVPLIESPAGIVNAAELATHPRVSRLGLGAIDMAVELGCEVRSTTMDYVRAQLVIACALAGKQGPLDSPSAEFKDDELVRSDTEQVKRAGCTGKLCIHPRQIPIVAEVFAPTDEEIDWARRVLEVQDGLGQVDGQMVDRPVILRARRILGV